MLPCKIGLKPQSSPKTHIFEKSLNGKRQLIKNFWQLWSQPEAVRGGGVVPRPPPRIFLAHFFHVSNQSLELAESLFEIICNNFIIYAHLNIWHRSQLFPFPVGVICMGFCKVCVPVSSSYQCLCTYKLSVRQFRIVFVNAKHIL